MSCTIADIQIKLSLFAPHFRLQDGSLDCTDFSLFDIHRLSFLN